MNLGRAVELVAASERESYPELSTEEALEHARDTVLFHEVDGVGDVADAYRLVLLLDGAIIPELRRLNSIGGVETLQSCAGHELGEMRPASSETREVDGVVWFRATPLFSDARLTVLTGVIGVISVSKLYGREDDPVVEVQFRREWRRSALGTTADLLRHWAERDRRG